MDWLRHASCITPYCHEAWVLAPFVNLRDCGHETFVWRMAYVTSSSFTCFMHCADVGLEALPHAS